MGFRKESTLFAAVGNGTKLQVSRVNTDGVDEETKEKLENVRIVVIEEGTYMITKTELYAEILENPVSILVGSHFIGQWEAAIGKKPELLKYSQLINREPDFINIAIELWNNQQLSHDLMVFVIKTMGDVLFEEMFRAGRFKLHPDIYDLPLPVSIKIATVENHVDNVSLLHMQNYKRMIMSAENEDKRILLLAIMRHFRKIGNVQAVLIRDLSFEVRSHISGPIFTTGADEIDLFFCYFIYACVNASLNEVNLPCIPSHLLYIGYGAKLLSADAFPLALERLVNEHLTTLNNIPWCYQTSKMREQHIQSINRNLSSDELIAKLQIMLGNSVEK